MAALKVYTFIYLFFCYEWYDEFEELHELPLDYRIKSVRSAILKYNRYYPDYQTRKIFDNYEDVLIELMARQTEFDVTNQYLVYFAIVL